MVAAASLRARRAMRGSATRGPDMVWVWWCAQDGLDGLPDIDGDELDSMIDAVMGVRTRFSQHLSSLCTNYVVFGSRQRLN